MITDEQMLGLLNAIPARWSPADIMLAQMAIAELRTRRATDAARQRETDEALAWIKANDAKPDAFDLERRKGERRNVKRVHWMSGERRRKPAHSRNVGLPTNDAKPAEERSGRERRRKHRTEEESVLLAYRHSSVGYHANARTDRKPWDGPPQTAAERYARSAIVDRNKKELEKRVNKDRRRTPGTMADRVFLGLGAVKDELIRTGAITATDRKAGGAEDHPDAVPISDAEQAALYKLCAGSEHYAVVRKLYRLAYDRVNERSAAADGAQNCVVAPKEGNAHVSSSAGHPARAAGETPRTDYAWSKYADSPRRLCSEILERELSAATAELARWRDVTARKEGAYKDEPT